MFSQKLFPPVHVDRCVRYEDRVVTVTCISAAVHAGTHVDAPCHFIPGGGSIDEIDLARVSGPAVCWEVGRGADEEITTTDLEACRPHPEAGDVEVISTGCDGHFAGDPLTYNHHPYLATQAA